MLIVDIKDRIDEWILNQIIRLRDNVSNIALDTNKTAIKIQWH